MITYAIADDHKIFRKGIKHVLADDSDLEFAGEAEDGADLLQLIEKQRPDVVLIDIKMPRLDGVEATQRIHAAYPHIKILVLTSYHDEGMVLLLLKSGAHGYLLKNADPEEIKTAIRHVYKNDYYFNDTVSAIMLRSIKPKAPDDWTSKAIQFNDREAEVLKLICQEHTATEIAQKVFLSPRTVEGIRAHLIEKTGVRNTAGLVVYAFKNGLIT